MKKDLNTIGLLGGMAWPSTQDYYSLLNKGTEKGLGTNHSAKCVIYSYDFDSINPTYRTSEEIEFELSEGIKSLQAASVDIILICSNTIHKFLDCIRERYESDLFLDIRDCIGSYLHENGFDNCLLIGTRLVMSESFYKDYISSKYNITMAVPDESNQVEIHSFIFRELINEEVSDKSIDFFKSLIESSTSNTIILACTELRIVFNKIKTSKTIIDSTAIHVNAVIDLTLKNNYK